MSLFKSTKMAAVVMGIAAGLLFSGCGSDGGGSNNLVVGGGDLILPDGYAWVLEDDDYYGVGYIFMWNNQGLAIYEYDEDVWRSAGAFTYAISGNRISILDDNGYVYADGTFSVSGSTAYLSYYEDGYLVTEEYIKTYVGTVYNNDDYLYKKGDTSANAREKPQFPRAFKKS